MVLEQIRKIIGKSPKPSYSGHNVAQELKDQWEDNGFALLKNAIPTGELDELISDLTKFRSTANETKDEFGYGSRIGVFHSKSDAALRVALNNKIRDFLTYAFKDDPVLYGSLCFETGTEQGPHNDSIFFHTDPEACMAGAWIALEDIHPEAGPLFYYPGSHKWHFTRGEEVRANFPDLGQQLRHVYESTGKLDGTEEMVNEMGAKWTEMLLKDIEERKAEKMPVLIKKGDVLIWHAHLIHGGMPRINRELTRKSMVTHFIGRKAGIFHMNQFFALNNKELTKDIALKLTYKQAYQGLYVKHKEPVLH